MPSPPQRAAELAEEPLKATKKKAPKEEEPAPEEDAEEVAARKAARKAAREAARRAAEEPAPAPGPKKRRAAEAPPPDEEESAPAGSAAAGAQKKKRRGADGAAVAGLSPEAFREAHEIVVQAGRAPEPLQTFEVAEPALGAALSKALRAQGYEAPTPIQAQAWPVALQGRDLVAVAKTGSGKTCGFLLPALVRVAAAGPAGKPKKLSYYQSEPARPSTLVLAPTRELAQQIAVEAERFAPAVRARVVTIYGGVPKGDQVRALREGADVLIATPGRLLDLAGGDPTRDLKPTVTLERVTYLVLDEADRMLDMGFEPDIRKIVAQCAAAGKPGDDPSPAGTQRQTLFFTATWPAEVRATAASLTSKTAVQIRIGQGEDGEKLTANKNVTQEVEVLTEDQKLERLKEVLASELKDGETGIVFAAQKATCDVLERELQKVGKGLWCRAIHSGKDQWVRDEALAKFRELTASAQASRRGVLVATDVASRGLDIPGVAIVIVFDFGRGLHSQNGGVESYVHRIGRTGRAGRKGRAVTFFTAEDNGAIELVELLKGADQAVPPALRGLAEAESTDRWDKDWKKSFYKKGGRNNAKGKGKGKGKGNGTGTGRGGGGQGRGKGGGRGYSA